MRGREQDHRTAQDIRPFGLPLIASHALGTSPRWGEEGIRCAVSLGTAFR